MPRTYIPELDLTQVAPHQSNPRRSAKADAEMVESIKGSGLLQPLLVAPTGDDAKPYVLIDGHRRFDGCKKARVKVAPAFVDEDLKKEGDQVEAMVLASLYREGLTPLEEAEAFEQLRGMRGFTQARISKKTGVPVDTIRKRLKLLKLSKTTQNQVHKGQLTLGDAMELVAFEDDPKTQESLSKAAGTPQFGWELQRAKRRRQAVEHADNLEAQLKAQGVPLVETPDGHGWFAVRNGAEGPVEVEATHSEEPGDHDGCYAYVRLVDYEGSPVLKVVCTDPASHQAVLDEEARERHEKYDAERAARLAELAAERERQEIARDLRAKAVTRLVEDVVPPAPWVDLLRSLVPLLVWRLSSGFSDAYQDLVGVERRPNGDTAWRSIDYGRVDEDGEAFQRHIDALTFATPAVLARHLAAVMIAAAEDHLTTTLYDGPGEPLDAPLVERYYELLEQLDYHRSDVDDEILAKHRGENPAEEPTS